MPLLDSSSPMQGALRADGKDARIYGEGLSLGVSNKSVSGHRNFQIGWLFFFALDSLTLELVDLFWPVPPGLEEALELPLRLVGGLIPAHRLSPYYITMTGSLRPETRSKPAQ